MGKKYRRVYAKTAGKIATAIGVPLIVGLFLLLSQRGDITITGYSGDVVCAGTELDPCYAYINFTANTDIYIYPNESWMFSTNPPIKKVILQRRWGNTWRTINLSKPWNNRVKYAVKFSKGKSYQIRFVGYKEDPYDDVKWGFGDIDPIWYGVGDYEIVSIAGRKYTPQCFGECHLPIKVVFYFNMAVTKDKIKHSVRNRIGKFNVSKFHIQYLDVENYTVNRYECTEKCHETANGTICDNDCVPIQVKRQRYVWKDLPDIVKIEAGRPYIIDFWVEKKPSLGFSGIDIVPSVNNYDMVKLAWWNSSWQYRREINITEQSGTDLEDYQVAMNITYDSDMQTDFDDLRFTWYNSTSNEEIEIPYWIESKSDGEWAYVWVKVPEIPANDNATVYMYYGNPSATSESNATDVFIVYDDFSWSDLESDPYWDEQISNSPADCYITSNYLECHAGYNSGWTNVHLYLKSEYYFKSQNILVEFDEQMCTGNNPYAGVYVENTSDTSGTSSDDDFTGTRWISNADSSSRAPRFYTRRLGTTTEDVNNQLYPYRGSWNHHKFIINSTHIRKHTYNPDEDEVGSNTISGSDRPNFVEENADARIDIWVSHDTTNLVRWDNVIVRRYVEPEPTYSIGEEVLGEPDLNLSFGPPNTYLFRFGICGPDFENASAVPENQTDTYGIDYLCNNGTVAGDVQVRLSGALNDGWTWYASNTSTTQNLIELTTDWKTIYHDLEPDSCIYIWHVANCSYVTRGPGAYEEYQIV